MNVRQPIFCNKPKGNIAHTRLNLHDRLTETVTNEQTLPVRQRPIAARGAQNSPGLVVRWTCAPWEYYGCMMGVVAIGRELLFASVPTFKDRRRGADASSPRSGPGLAPGCKI
jgi:hypothetical protein